MPTKKNENSPTSEPESIYLAVYWCDGVCEAGLDISLEDWNKIRAGGDYSDETTYGYEGEEFIAEFIFSDGQLQVTYWPVNGNDSDSGDGFSGSVADAASDDGINWYMEE
ncbi:MAG: hypothetical protein R3C18_26230 [Planctomycetaceae bacterium]